MDSNGISFAPKIHSGIDLVDKYWGGMYRGGSYLIYGRASSGRGLLTLVHAKIGVAHEETCLFLSPSRPKDLMIQAASVGFNLRQAYETGIVKLLRIPPMLNLSEKGDDGVEKALKDLVKLIRQHQPDRLVIDDFTPFMQFRSFDRLRAAFIDMLEQIDSLETTLLIAVAEPANQQSRKIVEFISKQMTGSVHIEETEEEDASSTNRRISLLPNIGHVRSKVVEYWDLAEILVPEKELEPAGRMLPPAKADAMPGRNRMLPPPRKEQAAPVPPKPQPVYTRQPAAEPVVPEPPPVHPAPLRQTPSPRPVHAMRHVQTPQAAQPLGRAVRGGGLRIGGAAATPPAQGSGRANYAGWGIRLGGHQQVGAMPLGRRAEPAQRVPQARPMPYPVPAQQPQAYGASQASAPYAPPQQPISPAYTQARGGQQPMPSPSPVMPPQRSVAAVPASAQSRQPEVPPSMQVARPPHAPGHQAPSYHAPMPPQAPSHQVAMPPLVPSQQPAVLPQTPSYRSTPPQAPSHRVAMSSPAPSQQAELPPSHQVEEPPMPPSYQAQMPAPSSMVSGPIAVPPHAPSHQAEMPPSAHVESASATPSAPASTSMRAQPMPPAGGAAVPPPMMPAAGQPMSAAVSMQPVAPPPVPQRGEMTPITSAPRSPQSTTHTDREGFRMRLQQHFHRRDISGTPFLAIAMRMDRSEGRTARPFDFEFILDLITGSLRDQDDVFVDLERERLIVLLAESRPEEAQHFFTRLKNKLREDAPQQAEHLLHSVSAIVVPDGRPFQSAEEFLTYALDEG